MLWWIDAGQLGELDTPCWRSRAHRCRRPDRLALFRWAGRGFKTRWRTGRDRDGLWATLPARSAPLWLATSEILDTFADDNVFRGQRRCAKHAVRDPRQRIDAVSPCRYRSSRLPDAGMAVVHRIADPQPARRAHARRRRSPGATVSSVCERPRREAPWR